MTPAPDVLYLELMKKTLSFTLWPEPPIPLEAFNRRRSAPTRHAVSFALWVLRRWSLTLGHQRPITDTQREQGRIWPGYADTMIGLKRLENIQYCIERVIEDGVDGDLMEAGVWRGGACIFMRAVLAAYQVDNRKVFVADSFEGLPPPDPEKWPVDRGDIHFTHDFLAVSQAVVENNFRKYGLLDDRVVFLKGYFADTLPVAPVSQLAVLRLDGDMYGSTMETLEHMYPKLARGGFCIIDDYVMTGCKAAVDDYRSRHDITSEMIAIDWTGSYWRKE